jgi:hypothetical protein
MNPHLMKMRRLCGLQLLLASVLLVSLETICGKRGISIAVSEIAQATATPRAPVSWRRYLVRRAAVTRIVGPRFRELASR